MKKRLTFFAVLILTLCTVMILTSCGQWDKPYDKLDREGATVSVRFEAGEGGMFAGTNGVTVVDVFNISDYKVNADGKIEISLLTPDDKNRGNNAFEISKSGHALAGWYVNGTNEPWDFSKKLEIDPEGDYSSHEPVLTLTAKWIPYTVFEFYEKNEAGAWVEIGEKDGLYLDLPEWDLNSGKMNYKNFLSRSGKTLANVFLDEAMTVPMVGRIEGILDVNATEHKIKIYTVWQDGEWFRVSDASHLTKNASKSGCYILDADIDFSDANWPAAFINNEFDGKIIGNGHKISGIKTTASITKGGDVNHGAIFGSLSANALIEDVTFENITYTVASAGAKAQSVSLGAIAGADAGATLEGVSITSSKIILRKAFCDDFRAMIESEAITIGLAFGNGNTAGIDLSGVTVEIEEGTSVSAEAGADGVLSFTYPDN